MNLDPIRFCYHCQQLRQRDSFAPLPGVPKRREVCSVCMQKIMAARKRLVKACFGVYIVEV